MLSGTAWRMPHALPSLWVRRRPNEPKQLAQQIGALSQKCPARLGGADFSSFLNIGQVSDEVSLFL